MRLDPEDILAKRPIVLGGIPKVTRGMITGKNDVQPPIQMGLTTLAANGHRMRHPSPTIKNGILRQTGGGGVAELPYQGASSSSMHPPPLPCPTSPYHRSPPLHPS